MDDDIVAIPRNQYQKWCKRIYDHQPPPIPTITMAINAAACTSSPLPSSTDATSTDFRSIGCLPPELLFEVLGYLTGHQSTLYYVSLVCRQWFFCATPILYKHPRIYNTYRWATFLLTLRRDKRLFHYGSLVHSIDLSCRDKAKDMHDKMILKWKQQESAQSSRAAVTTNSESTSSVHPSVIISSLTSIGDITNATTTTTITVDNQDNHDADDNTSNPRNNSESSPRELDVVSEEEYHMSYHSAPSLVVSTSSLIQLAQACPNLLSIDLSFTNMFSDSVVEETGDYISTLQHYAIPPGLTHVKVPIETAINVIGQHCVQLQQLKLQCCTWVCARVIWLWTVSCPNLTYLDARRSSKCSVKRLISNVLQVQQQQPQQSHAQYQQPMQHRQQQRQQTSASLSPSSSSSSLPPSTASSSSQAPLPLRSSSSSSYSSSSNSSVSGSTRSTSSRHWDVAEGSTSPRYWNVAESSNHASTSASASTPAASSSTLSSGLLQHDLPRFSSTALMGTSEEAPTEHGDQVQRQRHQQNHPPYPAAHQIIRLRRHHGTLPTNLARLFMTIYMNENQVPTDRVTGLYDFWELHGEYFEDGRHRPLQPPPLPATTSTSTTAIAHNTMTATNNVNHLPLAPIATLNAHQLVAASTFRSRAYREFVNSTLENRSSTVYITDQTLREYVWSVLKDSKDQGIVELEWLHD